MTFVENVLPPIWSTLESEESATNFSPTRNVLDVLRLVESVFPEMINKFSVPSFVSTTTLSTPACWISNVLVGLRVPTPILSLTTTRSVRILLLTSNTISWPAFINKSAPTEKLLVGFEFEIPIRLTTTSSASISPVIIAEAVVRTSCSIGSASRLATYTWSNLTVLPIYISYQIKFQPFHFWSSKHYSLLHEYRVPDQLVWDFPFQPPWV